MHDPLQLYEAGAKNTGAWDSLGCGHWGNAPDEEMRICAEGMTISTNSLT